MSHPASLALLVILVCVSSCSKDESADPKQSARADMALDMSAVSDMKMGASRDLASRADLGEDMTLAAADMTAPLTQCAALYGVPGAQTGLSSQRCNATCECDGGEVFSAQSIREEDLLSWSSLTLQNPFPDLDEDPYAGSPPARVEGEVCAVLLDPSDSSSYRLETFSSASQAEEQGGVVTHHGACGVCSTLENLVTYIRTPDMTQPVRECGLQGIQDGEERNIECLRELGFDLPCAQIWYYNTKHTRERCLRVCFDALEEPYHLEDGSLNACLACDERESGPIFKAIAGRTRRNSGLASAICRPCESVAHITHRYAAP